MKFYESIDFESIINIVKEHIDKGVSYCIYSDLKDIDDLNLKTICYIGDYPEITDDDEEIYPGFVIDQGLSLLFREELVQDVVSNVLHQKEDATNKEILNAVVFYDRNDNFLSMK